MALDENVGFGAACNRGLAEVRGPVTALVNPDVELLDDSLRHSPSRRSGTIGPHACSRRWSSTPDGSRQDTVHPRPASLPEVVGALRAACRSCRARRRGERAPRGGWAGRWAVRWWRERRRCARWGRSTSRIFMYGEDLELGLRAAEAGIATWFWPSSRVLHHGAHATAAAFGGEPFERLASARRDVVVRRCGRRRAAVGRCGPGGHVRNPDRRKAAARPVGSRASGASSRLCAARAGLDEAVSTYVAGGGGGGAPRGDRHRRGPDRFGQVESPPIDVDSRRRVGPGYDARARSRSGPPRPAAARPAAVRCQRQPPVQRPDLQRERDRRAAARAQRHRGDAGSQRRAVGGDRTIGAGRRAPSVRLGLRRLDRRLAGRAGTAGGCRSSTTRRPGTRPGRGSPTRRPARRLPSPPSPAPSPSATAPAARSGARIPSWRRTPSIPTRSGTSPTTACSGLPPPMPPPTPSCIWPAATRSPRPIQAPA